ncbi:MAG TPA: Ig-like domain-containing protein [Gemmatimonadales bacterium]|nr:Ig-like domain-containing protein [Gemmatimonadales bacterium]
MYPLLTLVRNGAALGALFLLAHCGGSDLTLPGDAAPAAITIHDGDGQDGVAGAELPSPIVVKVLNRRGEPVPAQLVAFSLEGEAGGGSITPESRTNEEGLAQAVWVLGGTVGTQSAVASVFGADDLTVIFEAVAGAAPARRIVAVDGNNQFAPIGTDLDDPLIVRVTDEFGNPVADVEVHWSANNGSVDPRSTNTGSDGLARTTWVLGSSTGSQSASASRDGLEGSPVEFTATALPGTADDLVPVSGNNQRGEPGQELREPLVVRLVDRDGNGIAGRAVTWIVGTGGGSVAPATSSTGNNGQAETRWTLGSSLGVNTVNAVVSGVGIVGFRATAVSGGGGGSGSAPSRLGFVTQPSDTERGRDITPPVQVEVLDQNGNRVTGEEFKIKLELTGNDDGKLKGHKDEETQSGVATFDDLEVNESGDYRLRATTDGLLAAESDVFQIYEEDEDDDDD